MIAGKVLEKIIKLYHKVLSTTTTAYYTPCNRHERDKIVKAEEILVFPKYEIKKSKTEMTTSDSIIAPPCPSTQNRTMLK